MPLPVKPVKYPVTVKFKTRTAKIYAPSEKYAGYRIYYRHGGKSVMRGFQTYSQAKAAAEEIVRDLSKDNAAPALTPGEVRDCLSIRALLEEHYRTTGRRISAAKAVADCLYADKELAGRPISDAISGFKQTVATIQERKLDAAIADFLASVDAKTVKKGSDRSQICSKYSYQVSIILSKFAATFPNTLVTDLTKEHIDQFFKTVKDLSPKTHNHYRNTLRSFFAWAVRKDFLPMGHRLGQADSMIQEKANLSKTEFYTAAEFAMMLEAAEASFRVILALGGLAGLRTKELLTLDWADINRTPGFIEITAQKSKTRKRRLVEICPSLAQWLALYPNQAGPVWTRGTEQTFHLDFRTLCENLKIERKQNGLRHSFATFHFALYGNENTTAKECGNSPNMIHEHYKGLATKAEAEKWFSVSPKQAENIVPMRAAKS